MNLLYELSVMKFVSNPRQKPKIKKSKVKEK